MRPLDRLILGLLADGKARTGRALEKLAGGLLKRGCVYVRLARLKKAGLVTTLYLNMLPLSDPAGTEPAQVPYYLTDAGKAAARVTQ